jgi:hypothetical protein
LRFASGDEELCTDIYERFGESLFTNFAGLRQELEKLLRKIYRGDCAGAD